METNLNRELHDLQSQGVLASYEVTEDGLLKLQLAEKLSVVIPKGKERIALESFKQNFCDT